MIPLHSRTTCVLRDTWRSKRHTWRLGGRRYMWYIHGMCFMWHKGTYMCEMYIGYDSYVSTYICALPTLSHMYVPLCHMGTSYVARAHIYPSIYMRSYIAHIYVDRIYMSGYDSTHIFALPTHVWNVRWIWFVCWESAYICTYYADTCDIYMECVSYGIRAHACVKCTLDMIRMLGERIYMWYVHGMCFICM